MLLKGIFWSNIRKHGFIKGTLGGYLMYPSLPLYIIFEKIILSRLTKVLVLFKAPALDIKDYISYGRVNLQEYSWFDRLNCHFCAYANGVSHMVSATLDIIGEQNLADLNEAEKKQVQKHIRKTFNLAKPLGLISYFVFVVTISGLLRYDKPDRENIKTSLKEKQYGRGLKSDSFPSIYPSTFNLRFLFKAFEHTLSIIESNWCPLTYANEKILLKHQSSFISGGYSDVVQYIMDETKDRKTQY